MLLISKLYQPSPIGEKAEIHATAGVDDVPNISGYGFAVQSATDKGAHMPF